MSLQDLLNRFIAQMDTLVPFANLAGEQAVVDVLQNHAEWFSGSQAGGGGTPSAIYQEQVAHSGFMLGYSYAEAFFDDLVRKLRAIARMKRNTPANAAASNRNANAVQRTLAKLEHEFGLQCLNAGFARNPE